MNPWRRPGTVGAMSRTEDSITFEIEVEQGADPIAGVLRRGEQELSFVGWVGLAGALERILDNGNQERRNTE